MLDGENIILAPHKKEYLTTFIKWFNDQETNQYLNWYLPMTYEAEEKWFQSTANNQKDIYFSILQKNERLIGNCGIRIDWKNRVGNVGIVIGEKDCWGKGFGTEAMNLMVTYCFKTLNFNRVELEVFSNNPRAQACYKKVGFKDEGKRRSAHFSSGNYIDAIIMGLLREEWEKL
jgi:RimJ/RimL family protein N-acetyltransferase